MMFQMDLSSTLTFLPAIQTHKLGQIDKTIIIFISQSITVNEMVLLEDIKIQVIVQI